MREERTANFWQLCTATGDAQCVIDDHAPVQKSFISAQKGQWLNICYFHVVVANSIINIQ